MAFRQVFDKINVFIAVMSHRSILIFFSIYLTNKLHINDFLDIVT